MSSASVATTRFVLSEIAEAVVENEQYFGELDAVVGDGDFGFSLARGFEKVQSDMPEYPDESVASLLRAVAMTISSRIGGTTGPLWGTAFLRASVVSARRDDVDADLVVEMLRAAAEGIQARGKAELGDKTLLDALVPATDALASASPGASQDLVDLFARQMRAAAVRTSQMQAMRGRASYAGERSVGSPDAGAIALAVLAERLAERWSRRPTS